MNLTLVKILSTTAFVNADETIEHVNNVLFFSKIFFVCLDLIIFFVPIYIISKIVRHHKSQDDADKESQIFETKQKSDANDSSYFDSPFEE